MFLKEKKIIYKIETPLSDEDRDAGQTHLSELLARLPIVGDLSDEKLKGATRLFQTQITRQLEGQLDADKENEEGIKEKTEGTGDMQDFTAAAANLIEDLLTASDTETQPESIDAMIRKLEEEGALSKELLKIPAFQMAITQLIVELKKLELEKVNINNCSTAAARALDLSRKLDSTTEISEVMNDSYYQMSRLFQRKESKKQEESKFSILAGKLNKYPHLNRLTILTSILIGLLSYGNSGVMLAYTFGGIVATLLYPFKMLDKKIEKKHRFFLGTSGLSLLVSSLTTLVTQINPDAETLNKVNEAIYPFIYDILQNLDAIKFLPAEFPLGVLVTLGLYSFWDSGVASRGATQDIFQSVQGWPEGITIFLGQLEDLELHEDVRGLRDILLKPDDPSAEEKLEEYFDRMEETIKELEYKKRSMHEAYLLSKYYLKHRSFPGGDIHDSKSFRHMRAAGKNLLERATAMMTRRKLR